MTIRQLEYFCAVAEGRSISAAARALTSPSRPSRARSPSEAELGVQLFARESRGMKLTEAGQALPPEPLAFSQSPARGGECPQHRRRRGRAHQRRRHLLRHALCPALFGGVPRPLSQGRVLHPSRFPAGPFERPGPRRSCTSSFSRRSTQESGSLHERILGEDALELIMTAATDPAPELDAVPIERLRGVPMCLLRSDDLWGYNDYLMKECRRSGF